MALRLRPWTVKRSDAIAFCDDVHRRLPKVQGGMWCVSVRDGADVVGIAIVGWPSQEQTSMEMDHLRVLRVAVKPGYPNACSMLYGAAWRAARAMGVTSMDTHTHLDEHGTSLKASGWTDGGLTSGGEHSRVGRPRKKAVDPLPKRRWWAPGSAKATKPETVRSAAQSLLDGGFNLSEQRQYEAIKAIDRATKAPKRKATKGTGDLISGQVDQ